MLLELELLYPGRGHEIGREIESILPKEPRASGISGAHLGPLLICYAWTIVQHSSRGNMTVLAEFLNRLPQGTFETIHLLPFYPATSDFGFSPISHTEVDPELGSWISIRSIGGPRSLMVDLILHHTSASHPWFGAFLRMEPEHESTYITVQDESDYAAMGSKRSNAVVTSFRRSDGTFVKVLTRYGSDQVDLNYANPKVLLRVIGIMAQLVAEGVRVFRLDAVSFLWNRPGTDCSHLPETSALVQIFREALARLCSDAIVVAEVDIDNKHSLYFGKPECGAKLVGYSYSFVPLLLETCLKRRASNLVSFLKRSVSEIDQSTVIRFLSTHDGLFMSPYAPPIDVDTSRELADIAVAAGGRARWSSDGNLYELNITFRDLLRAMSPDGDSLALCALALLVCLPGVPAIYLNTMLNIRNDLHEVETTGDYRAVNRGTIEIFDVREMLDRKDSQLNRWLHLIRFRNEENEFLASSALEIDEPKNGVIRITRRKEDRAIIVHINFGTDAYLIHRDAVACSLNVEPADGFYSLRPASFAIARFDGAQLAERRSLPEHAESIL